MTDFSESLKITFAGLGGTSLSGTVTRTGDSEGGQTVTLTALQANKHVTPLGIRKDGLTLLYMKSSTDCSIFTNAASGSSPDDTIHLVAGVPLHFLSEAGMTNPFSVDVTSIYVTETGNAACTLELRWLQDATP